MTKYDVKSPDGISIARTGYYSTTTEAGEALEKWVENYSRQGYYSSNMGRIPLEELALHCVRTSRQSESQNDTDHWARSSNAPQKI